MNTEHPPPLASLLAEHADRAGEYVADRIGLARGEYVNPFGDTGYGACRNDIAALVASLSLAVELNHSGPFAACVLRRMASVKARGLSRDPLLDSLSWLMLYFDHQFPPLQRGLTMRFLDLGCKALYGTAHDLARSQAACHRPEASSYALLVGDAPAVQRRLQQLAPADMGPAGLSDGILPALHLVGPLWQHSSPHPAPQLIAVLVQDELIVENGQSARRVLFACLEVACREIDLSAAARPFEQAGWLTHPSSGYLPIDLLLQRIAPTSQYKPSLTALAAAWRQSLRYYAATGNDPAPPVSALSSRATTVARLIDLWRQLNLDYWTSAPQPAGVATCLH